VVIEFAPIAAETGLYDVDIFAAHRVLDFAATLSRRELGQDAVAMRKTEIAAHAVHQLRVRVSPKNNDIPDHFDDSIAVNIGVGGRKGGQLGSQIGFGDGSL